MISASDIRPGMVVNGFRIKRVADGDQTPFGKLRGVTCAYRDPITLFWDGGCVALPRTMMIDATVEGR